MVCGRHEHADAAARCRFRQKFAGLERAAHRLDRASAELGMKAHLAFILLSSCWSTKHLESTYDKHQWTGSECSCGVSQ